MAARGEIREGEEVADVRLAEDACLSFIGVIRTPFENRDACPRQGRIDRPECTIVVNDEWLPALEGLQAYDLIEVFYWLDRARRDFLIQRPRGDSPPRGTFALRSPNRPNPIGVSTVRLERIEDNQLVVRGLDCIDGTPLLDIKPDRSVFTPQALETWAKA